MERNREILLLALLPSFRYVRINPKYHVKKVIELMCLENFMGKKNMEHNGHFVSGVLVIYSFYTVYLCF